MKRHPVFTPTAVPPERLDEITVGRDELIARLVTRLRSVAVTDARPHTLLVGSRGSGKTHLLSVALHRARRDPDTHSRLAVAWIPEDALSIGSYLDLLVELTRAIDATADDQARLLRQRNDAAGLERLLLAIANGRAVVLVLENLDRIFASIGGTGQSALRGFVETAGSVVLFASTPLLFAGIASRDNPWYGSFDIEHLTDLGLAEGTELLRRAAQDAGDADLAAFVTSPAGQARLRAVEQLAGGSPRLWHVLSGCITVASLDELIPAVESLLDKLAPYYQQRLWELPANEQKLVVELGRHAGATTVGRIAAAVGMSERAAATSLGRLAEARWVKRAKWPGTDQRVTWYELREPLLRHHLQFRDTRGEPLRFVVEFLKVWYSPPERRRHLLAAVPGSPTEQHFLRTFLDSPPRRSDAAWADRDPERLLVEAKCWAAGSARADRLSGSWRVGVAVQAVVGAAHGASSMPPLAGGAAASALHSLVAQGMAAVQASMSDAPADRVGDGLRALVSDEWDIDDRDLLTVLSACWDGWRDPAAARDRIAEVAARRAGEQTPLALTARAEYAFWVGAAGDATAARSLVERLRVELEETLGRDHEDALVGRHNLAHWTGETGDPARARDLFTTLAADREHSLGPDHEDTLATRQALADWTGEAGDPARARDLFTALVADCERVLGPHHPQTLTSRHALAHWTGEAGDPARARDLFTTLVTDCERVLGNDHPHTITSRHALAHWTSEAGDPAHARDLFTTVAADRARVLGNDHPHTMTSRHALAHWTGKAGDPAHARDLFTTLVTDREHSLGPDHEDTLATRQALADWTGEAGDPARARDLFTTLVPDSERVLGPHHPQTLTSRHALAHWTGEAGDPARARDLFTTLVTDCERVLGNDHPHTMTSRHALAYWTGKAGDPAHARDLFTTLVTDSERVLGPHHPQTLSNRHNLAHWTGKAGDPARARDLFAALVPDSERVLGPHHPQTLIRRRSLANWTGEAGDARTAHEQFAEIAQVQTRTVPGTDDVSRSLGSWLAWGLRAGLPAGELASSIPAGSFGAAVASMFATVSVPDDVVEPLLAETAADELAQAVLLALLTRTARPPGWRRAVFDQAAPRLDAGLRARLRSVTEALEGDAEALASQPAEIRPLVEELAALDRAAGTRS